MPTERDQDQELKDYLADQDDLSQAYRSAAGEEPPARLDAAILAASRKAAGSRPRRTFTRWHVPASLAAVVVLSVLVVFNIPDERAARTYAPAPGGNAAGDSAAGSRDEAGSGEPARESSPEPRALRFETETPAMLKSLPAEDREDTVAPRLEAFAAESRRPQQAPEQARTPGETSSQVTAQGDGRQADADGAAITACTMPRPEACTMEYNPVCAVKETAAGRQTTGYSNACHACSDPAVTGFTPGDCGEEPVGGRPSGR